MIGAIRGHGTLERAKWVVFIRIGAVRAVFAGVVDIRTSAAGRAVPLTTALTVAAAGRVPVDRCSMVAAIGTYGATEEAVWIATLVRVGAETAI